MNSWTGWSPNEVNFLPTLKALQKLSEDRLEVSEESGEVSVAEPKKVRGIGLVDFPARAVLQAVQVMTHDPCPMPPEVLRPFPNPFFLTLNRPGDDPGAYRVLKPFPDPFFLTLNP